MPGKPLVLPSDQHAGSQPNSPSPVESRTLSTNRIDAKERLIVALDLGTVPEARALVAQLGGLVSVYKIGLALQLATGTEEFIRELIAEDSEVFLDYKYFDVPETIRTAVERAAQLGVKFLTVHGSGGIIQAAVEGRGNSSLKILTVTVLTSLDAADIREMGFDCSVEDLVLLRTSKALDAGCDGVIASGQEAGAIRKLAQDRLLIVTPGIRPEGSSTDDHKRHSTPREAVLAGADYLVVGRPIVYSPNPKAAASLILQEMQKAFETRTG